MLLCVVCCLCVVGGRVVGCSWYVVLVVYVVVFGGVWFWYGSLLL